MTFNAVLSHAMNDRAHEVNREDAIPISVAAVANGLRNGPVNVNEMKDYRNHKKTVASNPRHGEDRKRADVVSCEAAGWWSTLKAKF